MNNVIAESGRPVLDPSLGGCKYETPGRDFDGTAIFVPCGAPVTQRPTLDDAYSAHLRATGQTGDEVQPSKLPLCDDHYKQLRLDIAELDKDDPYRIFISAEPTLVIIGWTLSDRENGYVSYVDGWCPGVPQHLLAIEVDLPPDTAPRKVADLVYLATNAEDLEGHPYAAKILAAVQASGYRGEEARHFSLSVGDTVTVGGVRLACEAAGWEEAS